MRGGRRAPILDPGAEPRKRASAPSESPLPRAAVLILPIAVLGIAFAGIWVRLADPAPPVIVGFYRMLLAAIAMTLWIVVRGVRVQWRGRAALLAWLAGASFGSDLALWQTSVTLTTVATATLLVNVTPVHVGLYAALVLRQPLPARFVAGTALALLGTGVLLGEPGGGPADLRGALLALGASFFYAGYLIAMAQARRDLEVFSGLFVMTLGAASVLGIAALLRGDPFAGFPPSAWAAMAGAATLSQLVGVLGIVWALRYLPTTVASVALLGQPVGAAVLAWWILDEPLGAVQAVGGIAVLAGIALASQIGARGRAAAQSPSSSP